MSTSRLWVLRGGFSVDSVNTNVSDCFLGLTWRKLSEYGKHWFSMTLQSIFRWLLQSSAVQHVSLRMHRAMELCLYTHRSCVLLTQAVLDSLLVVLLTAKSKSMSIRAGDRLCVFR